MTIDLQKFCGREQSRPNLHTPFSRGEWTYASDGHVAVRVLRIVGSVDDDTAPAAEKLPFPDSAVVFSPAPAIEIPTTEANECASCDGRGHKHDCPGCECTCEKCEGTGQKFETVTVGIGAAIFNAKYIKRIQSLPGLEFGPPHATEPMPFRFEGGDGLIMPMRGKAQLHVQVGDAEMAA